MMLGASIELGTAHDFPFSSFIIQTTPDFQFLHAPCSAFRLRPPARAAPPHTHSEAHGARARGRGREGGDGGRHGGRGGDGGGERGRGRL